MGDDAAGQANGEGSKRFAFDGFLHVFDSHAKI
jgi:hypothetical protein